MTTIEKSFSARQVPWTKIGTLIDDESVNAAEAARLGGIDYEVELRPAGFWTAYDPVWVHHDEDDHDDEQATDDEGRRLYVGPDGPTYRPGRWSHEESRFAVIRKDTDEWYSFVSDRYELVQFREAFEFMDNINPRYVAAGSLDQGRAGFMVVQLPEHTSLDVAANGVDDPHDLYVVLRTSHDLSKAITVSVMPLRQRCMNMMTLPSLDRNVPQTWSVRHVGDPRAKLKEAQFALTNTINYGEIYRNMITQFASVRIDADDLRHIVRRVLPKWMKQIDPVITQVIDRFHNADTVGFSGTGWGAVNAVSDYFQWGRESSNRTDQSVFTGGLDGATATYVNRTAQLVLNQAR